MNKMTITEEIENGDIITPNIFEKSTLDTMNFVELQSLKTKLKRNLDQAKSVLDMTHGITDMKETVNDVRNDFDMSDCFISSEISSVESDIEKYKKKYIQLKEDTIKNVSLINEVINEKYKNGITSSFLQKELLENINKKIDRLTFEKEKLRSFDDNRDYSALSKIENRQKDLESIIKAINDKEEMEYWRNRTLNKKVYVVLMKDMLKNFEKKSEFTKNILDNYFYPEKAEKIFNTIVPMINHYNNIEKLYRSIFSIYVLLYDIARLNITKNASSKNWYSRVFIMNILEYSNNTYDFHDNNPEWLKNTIGSFISILNMYSEFIPFDKIKKILQNSINIQTYYFEKEIETKIDIFTFKK